MQKRALIVDDERSNCELLERVLVAAGVEPTSVNNGAEALGTLRHNRFVVLFLDYHMAFPDGLELTRQARDSTFNRRCFDNAECCDLRKTIQNLWGGHSRRSLG